MEQTADERPRRRQARGERRIAQLLGAGVSPGTLYQSFPNKEAIAIELSDRLMHEMRETYGEALGPIAPETPPEEVIAAAVDRFVDFNCRHPVLFALTHGPDVPGAMAQEHDVLHAALIDRGEALLAPLLPGARTEEIARASRMCVGIHKGALALILAHEGAEREAHVQGLKNVLFRHLDPPLMDSYPLGV